MIKCGPTTTAIEVGHDGHGHPEDAEVGLMNSSARLGR
jgi:hypothetical protein